jgi:hypothetical protein
MNIQKFLNKLKVRRLVKPLTIKEGRQEKFKKYVVSNHIITRACEVGKALDEA